MTFWVEYEPSGLHEYDPLVETEFEITLPRLSESEDWRWRAGSVQRYRNKAGKVFWRSLNARREIFSREHATREEAAQHLLAKCPVTRERIAGRRRNLALIKRGKRPWYSPWLVPGSKLP